MRILWVGNVPWAPSGYGEQAALFVPRLQALGHEVAVLANFGLNGAPMQWNGITVYPSDNDWGNRSLPVYADHFDADLVIVLHDAWVMKPGDWPDDGPPVAIWAPVDHHPIPPLVLSVLANPRIRPVAMSRFGEDWMARFGLDPAYVPHGVDLNVFQPRPEITDDIRDLLGLPRDTFLAGMVAANQGNPQIPRKGFPQAFDAFARLARQHDDAYLYVHANAKPRPGGQGIDLETLALAVGMKDRIVFANDRQSTLGWSREAMAALYQSFDVLLNPSMGEGFGIPIIEAQACGVPVIVSDHSAMTELCGAGWLIDGDQWWDAAQTSFFFMPHVASIRDALEASYQAKGDQQLSGKAVTFAAAYDADSVTQGYWQPTLAKAAGPREVAPLASNGHRPNRKQRRATAKANR